MKSKRVAIIGAGPAGCMSAFFAQNCAEVTLFEAKSPLSTLLYTGGGRCNLAFAEYDLRDLAKNYPRGEKFLYSVFSRFSTSETLEFFEKIGVETYVQSDLRIFPKSDSAKQVRTAILEAISGCGMKKEKVFAVSKNDSAFLVETEKKQYEFDKVILAVGGHSGFELAKSLGHSIIQPKPALCGLLTVENFRPIQGLALKSVEARLEFVIENFCSKFFEQGDMLFTHEGVSGPLVYKLSSLCARFDYSRQNPLKIYLKLVDADFDLQSELNLNPKKDIRNLICEFVPKSFADYVLGRCKIALDTKCHSINAEKRDLIVKNLVEFEITVFSPAKEGEVVTSGGVCLDEINSKTMESKLVDGLYFAGEIIDVDGFCGGFNLQNCWSTGFVAGNSI